MGFFFLFRTQKRWISKWLGIEVKKSKAETEVNELKESMTDLSERMNALTETVAQNKTKKVCLKSHFQHSTAHNHTL